MNKVIFEVREAEREKGLRNGGGGGGQVGR